MTALEAEALSRMVSETLDTGEAGVEKAAEAGEWRSGSRGRSGESEGGAAEAVASRVEKRQQRQEWREWRRASRGRSSESGEEAAEAGAARVEKRQQRQER